MNGIKIFCLLMFFTAAILLACGGQKETGSENKRSGPTGQVLDWAHIPIYPGATPEDERIMTGLPRYKQFQTRIFRTENDPGAVTAFYKEQMPGQGWQSIEERELGKGFEITWGTSDRNTKCWVRIKEGPSGQGTEIEIILAQEK